MICFQSNFGRIAPVFSACIGIAYPFAVYVALDRLGTSVLLSLVGFFILLRLVFSGSSVAKPFLVFGMLAGMATALVALFAPEQAAFFYPVFMNAGASAAFGMSLLSSRSLIEILARVYEPEPTEKAKQYMRKLTFVWSAFLALNCALSLLTVLNGDKDVWLFYNGFLSYVLMGILFAAELVVRRHLQRRDPA